MSTRLLVVADPVQQRSLAPAFARPEFVARFETEGPTALQCARSWQPHLALLDLGCLAAGWREALKALAGLGALVFLLYGPEQQREMLEGVGQGAVSALVKPFTVAELIVRVRALARHLPARSPVRPSLRVGALAIDLAGRRALVKGRPLDLTPKEFAILRLLVESAGRVLTRRHILEAVWGYDSEADSRNVDWQISRLRRKLGAPISRSIFSVSGQGYCLRPRAPGSPA